MVVGCQLGLTTHRGTTRRPVPVACAGRNPAHVDVVGVEGAEGLPTGDVLLICLFKELV